jgi:hypothetical protein
VDVYPSEFSYKGQDEVRLTLEDPTARVHAFLIGKDAVRCLLLLYAAQCTDIIPQ